MKLSYEYIRHLAQMNHDDYGADNFFASTPIKHHKHWYLPSHFSLTKVTKNPYIRNDVTNLYRGSHRQWHSANRAIFDICQSIYDPHDMINTNVTGHRIAIVLIQPPKSLQNMKLIHSDDNHLRLMEAPILTASGYEYPAFHWFYSHQNVINRAIRSKHSVRLLSSIEATQYWTRLFIHNQLMVLIPDNTDLRSFSNDLRYQLGVRVSSRWLCKCNKDHDNHCPANFAPSFDKFSCISMLISKATHALKSHQLGNGDRNIEAIVAMVHYLYKQKKLPVAYGSNSRARDACLRFQHLSFKQKSIVMNGIKNSTYNHSSQIHISYKRLINTTARHLIKHYAYLLALASIKSDNSNITRLMNKLHWQQHLVRVDLAIKHHHLLARYHEIKHRLALIDWKLDHFNELASGIIKRSSEFSDDSRNSGVSFTYNYRTISVAVSIDDVQILLIRNGSNEFISFATSDDFLALTRSSGIPP